MAIEVVRGYEQISSKAYEHPADKAATSALHSVPLLDTAVPLAVPPDETMLVPPLPTLVLRSMPPDKTS